MTEASTVLKMTTLDCSDVAAETAFWSGLLGWEVAVQEREYAMLVGPPGAPALGLGLVADHRPPSWPDQGGGKQFHFDLACDDVTASQARAVELGASVADPQPGDTWRVLLSPAGHPFCLTDAARW